MVESALGLHGRGFLDDAAVHDLETRMGVISNHRAHFVRPAEIALDRSYPQMAMAAGINYSEERLAKELWAILGEVHQEGNVEDVVREWCPSYGQYVSGPFVPLFSGDSSHLRQPYIAVMAAYLFEQLLMNPKRQILGAQGTDTADVALLALMDAFLYDTALPPVLLTGGNRSHNEPFSDTPENFLNQALIATRRLEAGAFWVFARHLYSGADFVKIDPEETRSIEGQSTFFASHRTADSIQALLRRTPPANPDEWQLPPISHPLHKANFENIFEALGRTRTVNLGDLNSLGDQWDAIVGRSPKRQAVVIAAHSLGNSSNPIREAAKLAARRGDLVIVVSRSLIGNVSPRYMGSIISANRELEVEQEGRKEELRTKIAANLKTAGKRIDNPLTHFHNYDRDLNDALEYEESFTPQIIAGHHLNAAAARAIAVRAIIGDLDQDQTRQLMDSFAAARGLGLESMGAQLIES